MFLDDLGFRGGSPVVGVEPPVGVEPVEPYERNGRGEWIRTTGLLVPNQDISMTYEHRRMKTQDLRECLVDLDGPRIGGFRAVGPSLDLPFHVG